MKEQFQAARSLARSHTDNLLIRLGTARSVAANFSTGGLEKNYLHVVARSIATEIAVPRSFPPSPSPPAAFFAFDVKLKRENKGEEMIPQADDRSLFRSVVEVADATPLYPSPSRGE